jgi:dinuclear metal center YbgI/SA1388 family protein
MVPMVATFEADPTRTAKGQEPGNLMTIRFAAADSLCFDSQMSKVSLTAIVRYCDKTLRTAKVQDFEGAVNGLQMENKGKVTRIAAAVDASLATVKLSIDARADLLVVHHGLFWSRSHPWVEKKYELLRLLLESNTAVYSSHLPLDAHPRLGNNARLCDALGFTRLRPFFFDRGQFLGFQSRQKVSRTELARRLETATGERTRLIPGGSEMCQRIGVVTGGAGSELAKAAAEGVDTFVTGEGPHWTYALAEELGVNILYGGHYATETFGVKALAAELAQRFKVPWIFLDHPTGL